MMLVMMPNGLVREHERTHVENAQNIKYTHLSLSHTRDYKTAITRLSRDEVLAIFVATVSPVRAKGHGKVRCMLHAIKKKLYMTAIRELEKQATQTFHFCKINVKVEQKSAEKSAGKFGRSLVFVTFEI